MAGSGLGARVGDVEAVVGHLGLERHALEAHLGAGLWLSLVPRAPRVCPRSQNRLFWSSMIETGRFRIRY